MLELLSQHRAFQGTQRFYSHTSDIIGLPMKFSVFVPETACAGQAIPALFYLAGLTCTEETFAIKAGAQRIASTLGFMLIAPDTSPRGAGVAGETDHWDLGVGAGFYLNATQGDWARHYRMESYINEELYTIAVTELYADPQRIGIFGHSMGGHGALTLALKHPSRYRSVSAFAPVCSPSQCPWGQKAFTAYLGENQNTWHAYDACRLLSSLYCPFPNGILVDQGLADPFLAEQLYPSELEKACATAQQPLTLRYHEGFDHGYYFVSTWMEDHLRFHAQALEQSQ